MGEMLTEVISTGLYSASHVAKLLFSDENFSEYNDVRGGAGGGGLGEKKSGRN
jgi:hypothetical protein